MGIKEEFKAQASIIRGGVDLAGNPTNPIAKVNAVARAILEMPGTYFVTRVIVRMKPKEIIEDFTEKRKNQP